MPTTTRRRRRRTRRRRRRRRGRGRSEYDVDFCSSLLFFEVFVLLLCSGEGALWIFGTVHPQKGSLGHLSLCSISSWCESHSNILGERTCSPEENTETYKLFIHAKRSNCLNAGALVLPWRCN